MSDPRRLLSEGASDFEKDLLRSWNAEQPSDAARAKVLAAAGLGAAVTAGVAAKVAAAGGSLAPKAALSAGGMAAAKWLAIGALGFAVTGAAIGYVKQAARVSQVTAPLPTIATVPSPLPSSTTGPPSAAAPVATGGTAEATESVPAPTAPTRTRSRAPRAHPSALGEQVSALDSARRALASGDASGAIRDLDDYEARFPDGALSDEAEVLRVEALVASGDRAGAARVGQRFLSAHPNSPHAARVRALIAP